MYLCIRLILYLFSKISHSGFTSRSCVLPKHGSVARFILPGMFPPKKQVSNTIRKQLVSPILSIPLQYPGTYFTSTVVTVAGKVHSLVRLFMTVLSQQPNSIFQYFESQPALINISGQVQINFSVFYKSCVWCSQQQNKTSYLFKVNKNIGHYPENYNIALTFNSLQGKHFEFLCLIWKNIYIYISGIHMVCCDFPYINKVL